MEDAMARRLLHDFCAIPLGQQSVYVPIFGLTLFTGLDKIFYPYNLGFRKVARTVGSLTYYLTVFLEFF
jgi:hypothetical protein